MKHLTSVAFAVAIGVGLGSASSAEPTSYPLICKGGPDMRVFIEHIYPPRPRVELTVSFRWSSRAASRTPPAAGECAWLDRGGRASEPPRFRVEFREFIAITINGRGEVVDLRRIGAGGRDDPGITLINDIMAGRIFYLHAYAEGGRLKVTRLGP
jgi:hypothetical protein